MNKNINIAIAEDHELVRQGFIILLNKYHPNINIVLEASNGSELLKALEQFKPDIILLDIQMPGMSGIKLIEIIRRKHSKIKIIVISAHEEITAIIEYVKNGANAFLPKNCEIKELISTINNVYENGTYYNENLTRELARNKVIIPGVNNQKKLTERDILFIKCLEDNVSEDEICNLMNIKKGEAITKYKRRLFLKTNAQNIQELLSYAKQHNYL